MRSAQEGENAEHDINMHGIAIDPDEPIAAALGFGLENLDRITIAHLKEEVFRGYDVEDLVVVGLQLHPARLLPIAEQLFGPLLRNPARLGLASVVNGVKPAAGKKAVEKQLFFGMRDGWHGAVLLIGSCGQCSGFMRPEVAQMPSARLRSAQAHS